MVEILSVNTFVLLLTVIFLLYKFLTRNYDYFKKRNVPYNEPIPLFGNFLPVLTFRKTIGEYLLEIYRQTNAPFFGIFIVNKPHFVIRSPQLVKSILIRDFNHFTNRNIVGSEHDPILEHILFMSVNPFWRNIRMKLTPIFTSGKLKLMFPLFKSTALEMKDYINKCDKSKSIEAKELCSRYSTDVVGKSAFAINANSFKREDAEFRQVGKMLFDFTWSNAIQQTSYFCLPSLAKLFHMKLFDPRASNFLSQVLWSAIETREKSDEKGNDLIDLLIELRKNKEFVKENDFGT